MAGHELMWMEEEEEGEEASRGGEAARVLLGEGEGETAKRLRAELDAMRKELSDVRRDLAAKTIQLSKREAKAKEEETSSERASAPEVDVRGVQEALEAATAEVCRLKQALEEAEAAQAAQRRSLLEARTHAESATHTAAGEEAARMAYEHHAEYEIDRLNRELASLASRSNLMLQQKSGEVARMEAVVGSAEAERARAVAEAKESARAEMEKRLAEAERAADVEARSMRKRIIDLQMALEEEQEQDNSALLDQLAASESGRLTVRSEFDAFREMAASAARDKSSEISRLLEENAQLRARMAAQAVNRDFTSGLGIAMPYDAMDEANQLKLYIEGVMSRRAPWLGQRSIVVGLVGALLLLLFMFAVLRALASARGPNRWVCALEKLGLTIGDGCLGLNAAHIEELIDEIIEEHPRYHHRM